MERRVEYVTEYAAAGLDLIAAELEVCRLRDENAVLRYQYALALIIIRCLLGHNGQPTQHNDRLNKVRRGI